MPEPRIPLIHIELTRAEYAVAALQMRRVARLLRPHWPRWFDLVGWLRILLLPVFLVISLKAFRPVSEDLALIFYGAVLLAGAFYTWLSLSMVFFRRLPLEGGSVLRPHTIEIDATGLRMTSATTRAEMDWSAIKMVDDHAGLILLFVDRMSAMMIPRRAFPDAASADRFVAIVRPKIR